MTTSCENDTTRENEWVHVEGGREGEREGRREGGREGEREGGGEGGREGRKEGERVRHTHLLETWTEPFSEHCGTADPYSPAGIERLTHAPMSGRDALSEIF